MEPLFVVQVFLLVCVTIATEAAKIEGGKKTFMSLQKRLVTAVYGDDFNQSW